MSNLTPVRIGMLSYAHGHADSYASALAKLPSVHIVGVYDADVERGLDAAEASSTAFFSDVTNLLNQGLDGVVICSENAYHAPHVKLAAEKTRHILCEKPIATTVAEAEGMIAVCQTTGTKLQIAVSVRFDPAIQQLKGMLDRQELGRVFGVKCTKHGHMPVGWFRDPLLSGGGAVIDNTVHLIDVLRWFWQCEVAEVYAEVGSGILHPDEPIDDMGILSFRLANGIYGTLDTSWSRPASYPTWGDVKIEVVGERGVVTVNCLNQYLSVSSDNWGKTRRVGWGSDMVDGLIADFIDMIRTGRPPFISGVDGLRALEVALAAYQSAASHQPVSLAQLA